MITIRQAVVRSLVVLLLVSTTIGVCVLFPNAAENSESGTLLDVFFVGIFKYTVHRWQKAVDNIARHLLQGR